MGSLKKAYGYYKTGDKWIPILVAVSGKVVISGIPDHHLLHEIGGSDEIEGLSDITPDRINITSKASAYLSVRQLDLTNLTWTKVLIDTPSYDPSSIFASNEFTIAVAGYYLLVEQVTFTPVTANKAYHSAVYKNGESLATASIPSSLALIASPRTAKILHLAIDDIITLYARQDSGVNTIDIFEGERATYLDIHLLSV